MSEIVTKKLAIYYGYPSSVNGTYTVSGAVDVFMKYKIVVFGSGLENPSHPDYSNVVAIINDPLMKNTKVFGYVDSTLSLDVIQNNIDLWSNINVSGIFMDQFGYDYGLTRETQREIIWSIHEKGNNKLSAFVNAWNVDDVFGNNVDPIHNSSGLPTRMGPNDIYLAESFAVMNGQYDDSDIDNNGILDWQDKAIKMTNYKNTYGTKMASVTTWDSSPFDQNKMDYAYFASLLNNFDYYGFGEQYFSASSAQLPFRTRKTYHGTDFTSTITMSNGIYSRTTNVGIKLDTTNHTVDTNL